MSLAGGVAKKMKRFRSQYRIESISLLMLGNSGVGKTSLAQTYVSGHATAAAVAAPETNGHSNGSSEPQTSPSTRGVMLLEKDIVTLTAASLNAKPVRVLIWDAPGDANYRSFILNYARRCNGLIIVFNLNDLESYNDAMGWYAEACNATVSGMHDIPRRPPALFIGNKLDLCDPRHRLLARIDVETRFTGQLGHSYAETSAMNVQSVRGAIEEFVSKLLAIKLQAAIQQATDDLELSSLSFTDLITESAGVNAGVRSITPEIPHEERGEDDDDEYEIDNPLMRGRCWCQ